MPPSTPSNPGSPVTRRNPSTIWDSTVNGHSQISIAEAGRVAYLSGQIAARSDGGAVPSDIAGQARMVAASLAAALEDLQASARDVVLLRIYVVDATKDRFLEAWPPIKALLGDELPSVTAIGVQSLWSPETQLEVEMVVRVP